MKRIFSVSFVSVVAFSLMLMGCGNKDGVKITVNNTASGSAFFANSTEKTREVSVGDTVTIVATPKENCEFAGWYVGKEKTPKSTEANYTFVASESISLVARFAKSPTVSICRIGNGDVVFTDSSESSKIVKSGTEVTAVATPDENCEFIGWYVDDNKVSDANEYSLKVTKSVTLAAKFIKSPVISVSNTECGAASIAGHAGKSVILLTGTDVTVVAAPDKDCEFEGWFAGNKMVCKELNYSFKASNNVALVAKFYPSPVVTVDVKGKGAASFADVAEKTKVVLLNTEATVVATPEKNHEFVAWYAGDAVVSKDAKYTFVVSEDVDLVAKFKPSPIVSISNSENGSVAFSASNGKTAIVLSGTEITVTATPDEGFELYGWFADGSKNPVSKDLAYTFAVDKNVKLYAEFRRTLNGYDYVDLGLPSGLKWAAYNVGAASPEECGGYYAWGETEEKKDYTWDTYKYFENSYNLVTKYCLHERNGVVDGKKVLEAGDDVANANWENIWRMPTWDEFDELCKKCTWEWTTMNEVAGYKVTGPNGNSIFLPAAGYRNEDDTHNAKSGGYYWTSSLIGSNCNGAYYLMFDNSERLKGDFARRYSGRNVRAVFKK